MKLRNKIAAALGAVALAGTLGLAGPAHAASSGPPPPLTPATDISFDGNGNFLASCGAVGNIVRFEAYPNSCFIINWNYEWKGTDNRGNLGRYYYLHPANSTSLCMTASTTQYGVIKIEACVGATNQHWWNPNNGFVPPEYHIISRYYYTDGYLLDPSGVSGVAASFINSGVFYGNNGETFRQLG